MNTEERLVVRYLSAHPPNAARCLERLAPGEVSAILESVPPDAASGALAALPPGFAARCLASTGKTTAVELIQRAPEQAAAGILRRLGATEREELLSSLPVRTRGSLGRLLNYGGHSVGALMDLEYLRFFEDDSAEDVLRGPRVGSSVVYVVTRGQELMGVTTLRELRNSPERAALGTLAQKPEVTFSPNTDSSAAADHPCWLECDETPVVSRDGVLLGVLRHRVLRARVEGTASFSSGGEDVVLALGESVWMGLQGLIEAIISPQEKELRHG